MAVAKRQGRSKDQSEDFRQNKQQTALLAKPNLHRAGPGGGRALMSVAPNLCCDEQRTEEHTLA